METFKTLASKALTAAPWILVPLGFLIVLISHFGHADAKYSASPATAEMSKDIREAQEFVRQYEPALQAAKEKAAVYRETICRTEKAACTKEYLDPIGAGIDLSPFLAPAAE